jgi:hypothetical protein
MKPRLFWWHRGLTTVTSFGTFFLIGAAQNLVCTFERSWFVLQGS